MVRFTLLCTFVCTNTYYALYTFHTGHFNNVSPNEYWLQCTWFDIVH